MNFSERTAAAMNDQLMNEISASYTYLSMAEYCESLGLDGFGSWLSTQSGEEWAHAMKFKTYIQNRGERVKFGAVREPPADFSSVLDVFERALQYERSVSQAIADLYVLTEQEKDFASRSFLQWFLTEQVEEEKTVSDVIDWLKRIGDSQQGLYLLDQQLAGRAQAGAATTRRDAGTSPA
jgi:ferritin